MTDPKEKQQFVHPVDGLTRISGAGAILLALFFAGLAFADPPPEPLAAYQLPGDTVTAPAAGDQVSPAIARGGNQYLTVWTDTRTSFFDASGEAGSGRDIYAARLDEGGNLIDTIPIVINQDEADQFDPVVVWNGQSWLVLWTGTVPYGPLYHRTIEAARVSADGQVLDPEPILIWTGGTTLGTSGEHLFGAASDGTDWALVIVDVYVSGLATKTRLVGRRVTNEGTLIEAPYYLYSPSCCYFFYKGGLAYANGVYMAVFEGYVSGSEYGIFGLRMSPTLTTLDSYPVELTTIPMQGETHFYRTPNIAGGNGMFYVGWQLYISGGGSQIYGARVDVTGQSLDGNGGPISDPGPLSLYLSPDLVWDGTQWIASWESGGLSMARIDQTGVVLNPGGVELDVAAGAFAPAANGGLQYVRSEAVGTGTAPYDVIQTTISAFLALGPDQRISLGAPGQIQPDLTLGDEGYLLAYRSVTSDESRIMAHVLDSSAIPVAPEPVQLAAGAVDLPRVAFDGDNYLVVWSDVDAGEIHGRRLDQDGTVLDTEDLVLLNGSEPDIAGRGSHFFVTASQAAGVFGARVAGDGTVIDSPPLLLGSGSHVGPRVDSLGDYFAAVWEKTNVPDGSEIVMSLTNMAGTVVGPLDVTLTGDGLAHHRPNIAAGDTALIVWEDPRAGNGDIYGRRLTSSVMFLDPAIGFAITDAASDQNDVAVAWDGVRYLTCFTDNRNAVHDFDMRTDVFRNWVTRMGDVDQPDGVALLTETVPEIQPTVSGRQGNGLYAAAKFVDLAPFTAYRIWVRYAPEPTAVDDGANGLLGARGLISLYPNPANPAVTISFRLERSGTAQVDIFDLKGARVRVLQTERVNPGEHVLFWDGRDSAGKQAPSGTYLFRFRGDDLQETRKVTLVR